MKPLSKDAVCYAKEDFKQGGTVHAKKRAVDRTVCSSKFSMNSHLEIVTTSEHVT